MNDIPIVEELIQRIVKEGEEVISKMPEKHLSDKPDKYRFFVRLILTIPIVLTRSSRTRNIPKERTMKVRRGYYFYPGPGIGSNSIMINGDPPTLIDTGMANPESLASSLLEDGLSPENIGLIINTHGHPDHVGGNKFFKEKSSAKILIHKDEETVLKFASLLSKVPFFGPEEITFDDYIERNHLDLGKYELQVLHTPGHSPGSISLYDEKNEVLISGDTVFAFSVGRWDIPGGNLNQLKKSVKKLSQLEIKFLLPGHMGRLSGKREIERSVKMSMRMLNLG